MNWNEYTVRRRIDSKSWLESKGISSREQFLKKLAEINVDAPSEDQLVAMFPPEKKNESLNHAPERIDTSPARSMASEGDGSGVRSNGKRSSKVPNL